MNLKLNSFICFQVDDIKILRKKTPHNCDRDSKRWFCERSQRSQLTSSRFVDKLEILFKRNISIIICESFICKLVHCKYPLSWENYKKRIFYTFKSKINLKILKCRLVILCLKKTFNAPEEFLRVVKGKIYTLIKL